MSRVLKYRRNTRLLIRSPFADQPLFSRPPPQTYVWQLFRQRPLDTLVPYEFEAHEQCEQRCLQFEPFLHEHQLVQFSRVCSTL